MKLARTLTFLAGTSALLCLTSCMEQRVTDSAGNVIYEKPVVGTPWQSPETTRKQVQKNEEAMGIR